MVLIGLIFFIIPALNAQTGQISGLLNKITVHKGHTFDVVWYANPNGEPVSVIDFVLSYEPQYVNALDVQRTPSSPLNVHQVETTIDNEHGQIIYGVFRLSQSLPDTLFSFVKTQFTAVEATPNTELIHDLDKFPYTLMAYAGNNTMRHAENMRITILPELGLQSPTTLNSRPEFIVESGETGISINFNVKKKGSVKMSLRDSDDLLIAELFEMSAGPGVNYAFGLNDAILEPGIYVLELQDPSGTRTTMLPVGN